MIPKTLIRFILGVALIPVSVSVAQGQSASTNPVGYNRITCLKNSDTIVGVPFRVQGSIRRAITAVPAIASGGLTATLTISTLPGSLPSRYLMFTSGTRNGRWYDISSSTTSSATISLNGDTLTGVVAGESVIIAQYWTLDTLFPPAGATTAWGAGPSFIPNGHAIVASAGTSPVTRRTQILLPNNSIPGVNRPSIDIYFINSLVGTWVKAAAGNPSAGGLVIYPDTSLTIRHSNSVSNPTNFRCMGDVVSNVQSIVLSSRPLAQGPNDNYIAIPRPVDVTLNGLNLVQSGAFTASASISPVARRDQLFIYDNAVAQLNRAPSAIYYYLVDKWVLAGDSALTSRDNAIVAAGAGIVVRKFNTTGGVSSFWPNTPNY